MSIFYHRIIPQPRLAVQLVSFVMVLATSVVVWAGPADTAEEPELRLAVGYSSAEGTESSAVLNAGLVELRARVAVTAGAESGISAVGFGFSAPYARFGAVRPVGLLRFLYGPGAAGPLLAGAAGVPLRLDGPEDATRFGVSLGEDFGLVALAAASTPGVPAFKQPACGAWAAPRKGGTANALWWSAVTLASGMPAVEAGPAWYEPPSPRSERFWTAASVGAGADAWQASLAGAVSSAFPGADAAAGRFEAGGSLGPVRASIEASAAGEAWLNPDGRAAPAFRLDAGLRYTSRGLSATAGYRQLVERDAGGEPDAESTLRASLEVISVFGKARVACSAQAVDGEAPTLEIDTSLRPSVASWLTCATSWRSVDGHATRLDLLAAVKTGGALRVAIESGFRFVPEGRLIKASCGVDAPFRGGNAGFRVGTEGWVAMPEALESLEYSA
ncbi:MAG: hypothetical protein JXM71_03860, partial [Spirochaetales bacterium]|nr:hypothetical protein [Spirochaetales bacterium]